MATGGPPEAGGPPPPPPPDFNFADTPGYRGYLQRNLNIALIAFSTFFIAMRLAARVTPTAQKYMRCCVVSAYSPRYGANVSFEPYLSSSNHWRYRSQLTSKNLGM